MSNYTKTTNFAAKDSLPSGNANKIVKGTEIDTEFDNIATASATKADIAGPTFTGTVTIPTIDLNGGAIDGTTVGASTAAAITGTTIVANTSINIAGDGATVTGIKDEDDMSSDSATKLATQQSIKAYVDSQVTAQDLDFQADSGGALSIDLDSETLTFTGGTGVDTSGSGNAVTFAIDSTVATLTGTQTLTNKTLTSPTLNTPTIGTSFTIGSATITEAELEILDGATVTTAELNVLDGITSTTAELNILDGVTSTTAELNILDGVTSTAAELNILDGVTSTAAELNILDGVTATTAELNIMDGVTATTAELNYVDGVTSNVQTQLDAKAPIASPTFTGTVTVPGLTTSADILFGDNDKAIFGAGSDLQIYHDGSNSYIDEAGQGTLYVRADSATTIANPSNTLSARFRPSTYVSLYYNGVEKLATSSTGIDVTGNITVGTNDTIIAENNIRFKSTGAAYIDHNTVGQDINFRVSGSSSLDTTALSVTSAGNVGIGTDSPTMPLSVKAASNAYAINMHGRSDGYSELYGSSSDGSTKYAFLQIHSSQTKLHTLVNTPLLFGTNSTERMRLDASGNLLVGTTTTAAGNEGMVYFNGSSLRVTRDSDEPLNLDRLTSDGTIVALKKDGTTVGSIGVQYTDITYICDNNNAGLAFDGTATRIFPCDSDGTTSDADTDLGSSAVRFKDLYLSGVVRLGTSTTYGTIEGKASSDLEIVANAGQVNGNPNIIFKSSNAGGAVTERARIDNSGNLLVGTTTASIAATNNTGAVIVPNGASQFSRDGGHTLDINRAQDGEIVRFRSAGNAEGSISISGSTTSYNTSSDQRLKENIADADDAGSKVDAIQVRKFDWIADGSHQDYGMVAQELLTVAPEAVSAPEDPDEMMGVDYSKLVPMLVKEIQSLRARVAQLEN